jgi:hypothetical protein
LDIYHKEYALNYQDTKHSMLIIMDAFCVLAATRQIEGEKLQKYTKMFKVSKDVSESHLGGPIILQNIITRMNGHASEMDCKNLEILIWHLNNILYM